MWIFLVAGLSIAAAAVHHDGVHYPGRNQRIIKLHSSPYKHHPHHKHTRPGPLGPHIHYHDDHDHHYEYIRPNRPPPIPPFVNGPPPSSAHKYHSRPSPSSYSPYKASTFGSPYKSGNNFRSPAIKDHFRSPPPPPSFPSLPSKPLASPSFEYLPSSNPSLNHIINSDDNRGPIHEIPAPNLGPKPDSAKPVYGPPETPNYSNPLTESPYIHFENKPSHDYSTQVTESPFSHFGKNSGSDFSTQPTESPFNHYGKKPSYEVVESNDKVIEQSDGSKGYYAPDPDPSLPAPKIPPTHDPHSIPSNPNKDSHSLTTLPGNLNENFPTGQEYQILEAGSNVHAPIPNLSSQELYDLMHSFPNDQYTLVQTSVIPQPVVTLLGSQTPYQPPQTFLNHQQYVHQPSNSHQEVENNGIVHSSVINHQGQQQQQEQQYHDFNNPAYQSFNYEENNPSAAAVPMDDNFHNQFRYEPDTSESENRNSLTVIRNTDEGALGEQKKTESVKKTLPNDLSNLIPDDDFDKDFEKDDKSPIFNIKNEPEVPFYSVLPNKETAEALATLQAAGSVASKINQMRGDQSAEEEEEEKGEEVRSGPFAGLPQNEISKPQQINNGPSLGGQMFVSDDYEDEEPQTTKTDNVKVEVQKSVPLYEGSFTGKSLTSAVEPTEEQILANLDVGQGAVSEKFGRKIRPK